MTSKEKSSTFSYFYCHAEKFLSITECTSFLMFTLFLFKLFGYFIVYLVLLHNFKLIHLEKFISLYLLFIYFCIHHNKIIWFFHPFATYLNILDSSKILSRTNYVCSFVCWNLRKITGFSKNFGFKIQGNI